MISIFCINCGYEYSFGDSGGSGSGSITVPHSGWIASCPRCHARKDPKLLVGKDAPMIANEFGGKQSQVAYRCDLLPATATLAVAGVLDHGEKKYGADNWRKISTNEHLNHAMIHAFAFLAGDKQDDHLEHAACRFLMALEMHLTGTTS